MIVVLYNKADGRLFTVHEAPELDPADFETDTVGAFEYLGEDALSLMGHEWWVQAPLPGIHTLVRVDPPSVAHYYWDWAAHTYVGNLEEATTAARERVQAGRDAFTFSVFTWSSKVFLADQDAQLRIRNYALEALVAQTTSSPFTVTWRLADDSTVVLSASDMLAVFAAMQAQARTADTHLDSLLTSIDSAAALTPVRTAIDALNLLTWTDP